MATDAVPVDRLFREVEQVNELYRTVRLNRYYYGELLARAQRRDTWLNWVIAFTTSSSLVAWLTTHAGAESLLLGGLPLLASAAGVVRALVPWPRQIARYSALWQAYQALDVAVEALIGELRTRHAYPDDLARTAQDLLTRYQTLSLADEPTLDASVREQMQQRVTREIPSDWLWWPSRS
jgi:hypothetical protein